MAQQGKLRFAAWRAPGSSQRPGVRDCQPGIGVSCEAQAIFETNVIVSNRKPGGGGGHNQDTAPLRFKLTKKRVSRGYIKWIEEVLC